MISTTSLGTLPRSSPRSLTMKDFSKMISSSSPFARKFHKDDPVLDKIDKELLGRTFSKMISRSSPFARKFHKDDPVLDKVDKELLGRTNHFAPGACSEGGVYPCSIRGDDSVLRPGPGAQRLLELVKTLLSEDFRSKQCSTQG